ncbi:hypothetical protein, partial [Mesorhizobium sp. M0098]|uniref:hypothetical protein n=1 Tax=Mesorhizobium sp. M0098 TaxID=2956878 RepID=UPI003338F77F
MRQGKFICPWRSLSGCFIGIQSLSHFARRGTFPLPFQTHRPVCPAAAHIEGPAVFLPREELVPIDEIKERHRLFAQGMDDVPIIDDLIVPS